jgi:hypothetical protein
MRTLQTDWASYQHRYERWTFALRSAECDRRQRSRIGETWHTIRHNASLWRAAQEQNGARALRARKFPAQEHCKLFPQRGLYA